MSAPAYAEDQLVDQPALGLFAELGWQVAADVKGDAYEGLLQMNAVDV